MVTSLIIISIMVSVIVSNGPQLLGLCVRTFGMLSIRGPSLEEQEQLTAEVRDQLVEYEDVFREVAETFEEMPSGSSYRGDINDLPLKYSKDTELIEKMDFILNELNFESIQLTTLSRAHSKFVCFEKLTKGKFVANLFYYFSEENYPSEESEMIPMGEGWYFYKTYIS